MKIIVDLFEVELAMSFNSRMAPCAIVSYVGGIKTMLSQGAIIVSHFQNQKNFERLVQTPRFEGFKALSGAQEGPGDGPRDGALWEREGGALGHSGDQRASHVHARRALVPEGCDHHGPLRGGAGQEIHGSVRHDELRDGSSRLSLHIAYALLADVSSHLMSGHHGPLQGGAVDYDEPFTGAPPEPVSEDFDFEELQSSESLSEESSDEGLEREPILAHYYTDEQGKRCEFCKVAVDGWLVSPPYDGDNEILWCRDCYRTRIPRRRYRVIHCELEDEASS